MASNQDIREWAAREGIELKAKGPLPKSVRTRYAESQGSTLLADPVNTDEILSEQGETVDAEIVTELAPTGYGAPTGQTTDGETPPNTTAGRRFFGRRKGATKAPRGAARRGPRESTETLVQGVWTIASNLLGGAGFVPLARVLELQAPVAGAILDKDIRGTKVDTLLQPIARLTNKTSNIGTLVALPLFVQVASMRPELYPALRPHMENMMYKWMELAGPEMEKRAKRMEKRKEQLGGFDAGAMLDALFGEAPQEAPYPEAGQFD